MSISAEQPQIISWQQQKPFDEAQVKRAESLMRSMLRSCCQLDYFAPLESQDLAKASVLCDTLASEINQRMECRRQVSIYDATESIPVERTKAAILTACNMHDTVFSARRLRKWKPSLRCPVLMKFRDEDDSMRLFTSQTLLSSTQTFQTVKVKAARTRRSLVPISPFRAISTSVPILPTAVVVAALYTPELKRKTPPVMIHYWRTLQTLKPLTENSTAKLALEKREDSTPVAHSLRSRMLGRLFRRRCFSHSSAIPSIVAAEEKPPSDPSGPVESLNSNVASFYIPYASTLPARCSPPGVARSTNSISEKSVAAVIDFQSFAVRQLDGSQKRLLKLMERVGERLRSRVGREQLRVCYQAEYGSAVPLLA
ncbi:hypothetical protein CLF_102932 [Clonorchis sinensis]|uniref:Uncharacterized protein n=1 Tax=Clonorchis sinensis TaxID=79923 RepID=G7Y8T3_CLOSI|nr:hypothetical protein CLF_102932 [Clonorchis sinensis]